MTDTRRNMAAKEEKGFIFARPKDCGQKTRSRACSLLWMSSGTKTLSRKISVSKFESHVDETSNVIWRSFNILLDLSGRGHILRSFSCTWAYRIPYFSHNRKILFRVQLFIVIFFFSPRACFESIRNERVLFCAAYYNRLFDKCRANLMFCKPSRSQKHIALWLRFSNR